MKALSSLEMIICVKKLIHSQYFYEMRIYLKFIAITQKIYSIDLSRRRRCECSQNNFYYHFPSIHTTMWIVLLF